MRPARPRVRGCLCEHEIAEHWPPYGCAVTECRCPASPIRAQRGQQEAFVASAADVAIYGGSAGCGKTRSLLLIPLQYADAAHAAFSAVIFRRTHPEIVNPGGMWDDAGALYASAGAIPKQTTLEWSFPAGPRVKFAHMQYGPDRFAWRGAQVPMFGFDQLENFSAEMFWAMLHPNRDPSGQVRPFIRGTCNPVPADDPIGGWLHQLVAWWLDEATGFPRWERGGLVRWFIREGDDVRWLTGNPPENIPAGAAPKSLTFIPGRLSDNPALLIKDPAYRANLMAMPLVERERLLGDPALGGNWHARPTAGKVFNPAWFPIVEAAPRAARRVRAWDKAASPGAGDYSVGVLMAEADGIYYVEDVVRGQWSALERNVIIRQTARDDGYETAVWLEQEGSSGGKESAELSIRELAGYNVRAETVTGDKSVRARGLSAQAEAKNVRLVAGPWNRAYLAELHSFPDGGHDDQVDASSFCFNKLALDAGGLRLGVIGGGYGGSEAPRSRVMVRL